MPHLQIVALNDLFPHEVHDDQRLQPLIDELQKSGMLANPPIVTPNFKEDGRYIVLDGANRINAFKRIGILYILVQVVAAEDPGLKMDTWNHIIWGITPQKLLSSLKEACRMEWVSNLEFKKTQAQLKQQTLLCFIQMPDRTIHAPALKGVDLIQRVQLLRLLVGSYQQRASLDRTAIQQIKPLLGLYDELAGLLVFPHFSIHDILNVCQAGELMPPGITRTVIIPRALQVNYPLQRLASEGSLDEKNHTFQQWLQERLAQRGVRYYEEGTVIYTQ